MRNSFIEVLEYRQFLSGVPLDPNFGADGVLAGLGGPISVQSNGKILVDTKSGIKRLNPDGSVDAAFNPKGVVDTWKDGVALQSDGKLLVLSGSTLSRYNSNGTLDSTFGIGGHVATFTTKGTSPFVPTDIALQGTKVIVLGQIGGLTAMQRLNANGKADSTFPLDTKINAGPAGDSADPFSSVRTSTNGTIYVTGGDDLADFENHTGRFGGDISRFNSNGTLVNAVTLPLPTRVAANGAVDISILGATAQQDGRVVVVGGYYDVNALTSGWFAVRFNANLSVDTAFGGGHGYFSAVPFGAPNSGNDSATQVAAGPDGSLLLDIGGNLQRLLPQPAAGASASVLGYLFDDANGDGKPSAGEAPLAYWQVYADLHSTGVYQAGDPTAFADAQGDFTLVGLTAGTYRIREIQQTQWDSTAPSATAATDYFAVKLKAGQSATGIGFGNKPANTSVHAPIVHPIAPLDSPASLDLHFAEGGILDGYGGPIRALANGQILVDNNGSIHRLNPDGTVDHTFNPAGAIDDFNNTVWTQPGGKIIKFDGAAISRYNANGTLDTTFGVKGHVSTFLTTTAFPTFVPVAIALQGSKIIIAGYARDEPDNDGADAIERLTADGAFDTKFGIVTNGGAQSLPIDNIGAMAVAVDGHIFIATNVNDIEPPEFLTRFNPDGTNIQTIAIGNGFSVPRNLAIAPGGQVILVGVSVNPAVNPGPEGFDLVVDSVNGNTMTRNGETLISGEQTFTYPPENPYVAEQADGKILISGVNPKVILRINPFAQSGTASITGRIYNDLNADASHEVGEPGLAYWAAYVDLNDSGIYQAGDPIGFADRNGNYQITGLSPGTDIVREVRLNGWRRTQPAGLYPLGFYTLKVAAAKTYSNINFGNSLTNLVTGTVFNDVNGNGRQDPGDAGLAGWKVEVDAYANGKWTDDVTSANTNSSGIYQLVLGPGTYRLHDVLKSGLKPTVPVTGVISLTLMAGQTVSAENFGLNRGKDLSIEE
jgi:uncharacterized delta-60 repeat protein